jgi:hypothetical protein
MIYDKQIPFNIEWLPQEEQHYHGPRKRMREFLQKYPLSEHEIFRQEQVIDFLVTIYSRYIQAIMKVKFYKIVDETSTKPLHFFIIWCNYNVEAREELYQRCEEITASTGWYPVITGHRAFHHQRQFLDYIDNGLKKAMNKSAIERLPGLGKYIGIVNLDSGLGTSILVKTTTYDLILDTGMPDDKLKIEEFRETARKWIFISHSHKDHTGGMNRFVKNKNYIIAISPISLELFLNAIADYEDISSYLAKDFFYRLAPMWYRSKYRFSDGSSIETIPTYHFPGSMGYLFTFSNGKTLFYSGDLNVSASYFSNRGNAKNLFNNNRLNIDYGIIDGAYIGRQIGSHTNSMQNISQHIESSLMSGRNFLVLTPPSDYGLFLYLHLYELLVTSLRKQYNICLFLDSDIINQLNILEWRIKRKETGSLDDAIIEFLEKRKTLAESVLVYDFMFDTISNLEQINERNINAVFVLNDQKFTDNTYLSLEMFDLMENNGLDIARFGKAVSKPTQVDFIDEHRIQNYDDDTLLLHTTEQLLVEYFLQGNHTYENVYLFHNFGNRLKRFILNLQQSGYNKQMTPL